MIVNRTEEVGWYWHQTLIFLYCLKSFYIWNVCTTVDIANQLLFFCFSFHFILTFPQFETSDSFLILPSIQISYIYSLSSLLHRYTPSGSILSSLSLFSLTLLYSLSFLLFTQSSITLMHSLIFFLSSYCKSALKSLILLGLSFFHSMAESFFFLLPIELKLHHLCFFMFKPWIGIHFLDHTWPLHFSALTANEPLFTMVTLLSIHLCIFHPQLPEFSSD